MAKKRLTYTEKSQRADKSLTERMDEFTQRYRDKSRRARIIRSKDFVKEIMGE